MIYDPDRITFFAKTDARGKATPFGIKAIDRARHVYVIGKTGMGKSTLLENMAVQDIKNGEGMAFIDPHGQTAETLLDYIPEERMKDVLYFAPFDMDHPVSFNVMEDVGADKRHLVVSGLMSTFKKIWVDAWSARMEYILSNTLLALLEYPDSTLLGVNRMLSDKVYRKKVIDNITDPAVKSFWVDEFLKYNERYMQEAGDAIKNKIGQFTANPLIRNIIGQPKSSFDIREMMDDRKIIIMNLSKGLIGETNANLLGSMLITRIYLASMSRADLSPQKMKEMPNFYFYVDEFQSFANEAFANILSEARKYKLNLTIAHQYIEQMEEEVKNAVFGNVGTTISFRVGPFDAEVLETIFAPKFYAVDICNLGFAQVYLTLMIDGIGSAPFSAVTLPPIQHEGTSCKDMIIHSSRSQYAHTRAEVEGAITEWHGIEQSKRTESNNQVNNSRPPQRNNDQRPIAHDQVQGTNSKPREQKSDQPPERAGRAPVTGSKPSEPRSNSKVESPSRSTNGSNGRNATRGLSERRENNGPQTVRKEPRTPKNDGKSLEELRAVLSGMTSQAKNPESKPDNPVAKSGVKEASKNVASADKKHPPKNKQSQTDKVKPEDLKVALSEVLKMAPTKATAAEAKNSETAKLTKTEPKAETPIPKTEPAPIVVSEPVSDDRFNPKQLERMMRVNTSDKTPLK